MVVRVLGGILAGSISDEGSQSAAKASRPVGRNDG
jgi:hypothetical protein